VPVVVDDLSGALLVAIPTAEPGSIPGGNPYSEGTMPPSTFWKQKFVFSVPLSS
jgi:hypothetical protein